MAGARQKLSRPAAPARPLRPPEMPNYCLNRLQITAAPEVFYHFIAAHKGVLSFNRLVPLRENTYENAIERWGTKWDIVEQNVAINPFDTRFETAWTPPRQWLRNVAQQYPDITFKLDYYEPGVGFRGVIHAHGLDYDGIRFEGIERCVLCDRHPAILWTAEGNWRRCFECQGLPADTPYFDVLNGHDE